MALDTALEGINSRLKACQARCQIEQKNQTLSLRATLPDRNDPAQRRQQRIPLGLKADYSSLSEAEAKALELGRQLRGDVFSWDSWVAPESRAVLTPADFHKAAQKFHASKYLKSPERGANAWAKKWAPALRKLPTTGPINERILLKTIESMPEGSAGRRDQGNLLAQIAKSIGLESEPLLAASRGYGVDKLTEREIPKDREIEAALKKIQLPHWRWTFGMCAAYGLRPHECADLQWVEKDWITVDENTKTGARKVTPCPSEWVALFSLRSLPRPTQAAQNIAKAFNDALDRDQVTIKPYNLRHAYALRLMDNGVPPELGARLMGHSLTVHEDTYKRWLGQDRITKAMDRYNL
jgi:integrase